MMEIFIKDL